MTTPDAAFSPYYQAPRGVEDEPCRHSPQRTGIGPTGRKPIGFTADVCGKCGRIMRSIRDINWRDYDWARRFNKHIQTTTNDDDSE